MARRKSQKTETPAIAEELNATIIPESAETVTPGGAKPVNTVSRKQKILKGVRYWVVLNIGIFLLSFSVAFFENPNNFLMGGVSAVAIFLSRVIPVAWLTYDIYLWVINVILGIIGFIFLGKGLGIKTVYCFLMYNLEVTLLNLLIGYILPNGGTVTGETGTLLEAIFACAVAGVGQAIIFYCGASSGGTDIIALIIKKYRKINISFAIIAIDFVVATLSFFKYFDPGFGIKIGMLSILGVTIRAFAIDGIIENIAKTKYVTIITSKPEIAAGIIVNNINRGYTKYKAEGGFTGEEKTIIITVLQRSQAIRLKEKLSKEDPTAFTIITDANEILGNGFAKKF